MFTQEKKEGTTAECSAVMPSYVIILSFVLSQSAVPAHLTPS